MICKKMTDKEKVSELTNVLKLLVHLKSHKDENGKDEWYLLMQPRAWHKARKVLKIIEQSNT